MVQFSRAVVMLLEEVILIEASARAIKFSADWNLTSLFSIFVRGTCKQVHSKQNEKHEDETVVDTDMLMLNTYY